MQKRLCGVLIVVAVAAFFLGCNKKPQESVPRLEEAADLSLSGVSFVQTRNGVKEWELRADQAQLFEKDQTARLKKISVVMQTQKGDVASAGVPVTVSGESGKMDMEGKSFSIQNEKEPVSMAWGERYTMKTSKLNWSSEEQVIQTDGAVTITGSGMSIRGDRLKIFLDRSELTVLGDVHAEVY